MLSAQLTNIAEHKQPPETSSLPPKAYIRFIYPRRYYIKFFEMHLGENFKYVPEVTYNIQQINEYFTNNYVEILRDATRTPWKMGKNAQIEARRNADDSLDTILKEQINASQKAGIDLNENEARALTMFAMFYKDEFLQGGFLSSQKMVVSDLLNYYDLAELNIDNDPRPHIVDREIVQINDKDKKKEKQLIIVHKKTNINNVYPQNTRDKEILLDNQFNIRQSEQSFTLSITKNDIQIHKRFWSNTLIPYAFEKLRTIHLFEDRDLFHFTPLLCKTNLAFAFFEKLIKTSPDKLQKTLEYVNLCFSEQPNVLANILAVLECVKVKRDLEQWLYGKNNSIGPRQQAAIILENLNASSHKISKNNVVPLTQFLRRVSTSIQSPTRLDNNLQELIYMSTEGTSWNKLVGGSGIILAFVGAVVIGASIALAVASFGGSSIFSAWGITVGTSLLTKFTAIMGATAGASMVVAGIKLTDNKPNYFTNQNSLFWRQLRKQTPTESKLESQNNSSSLGLVH